MSFKPRTLKYNSGKKKDKPVPAKKVEKKRKMMSEGGTYLTNK